MKTARDIDAFLSSLRPPRRMDASSTSRPRTRIGPTHPVFKKVRCRNGIHCTIKDCAFVHPRRPTILVDGMNLCHSLVNTRYPSARPLVNAIRHYERKGHRVRVVMPEWAYYGGKDRNRHVDAVHLLKPYVMDGTVSFSPSYTDDDVFILKYARANSDVRVLSNDNYGSHISKGVISEDWRSKNVIKYMFIGDDFLPEDPVA